MHVTAVTQGAPPLGLANCLGKRQTIPDEPTSQAELNYDRYINEYQREAERTHMGEVALMVDGEIEGWFPSMEDAYNAGMVTSG